MKRLMVAFGTGGLALVVALVADANWAVSLTGAWAVTATLIVTAVWTGIGRLSPSETAARAQSEDFTHGTADLVVLTASTASLVAVGFILIRAAEHHGIDKALLVGLAIVSVAISWAAVHTIYTLRYSDLYYRGQTVGGIDFPGGDPPDYKDFGYLAFTIGMTYQVSDTDLKTKQIRRAATRHALLSYLFGAVILGVAINTVSSLLR
jgi:uncharacterized membrane protein